VPNTPATPRAAALNELLLLRVELRLTWENGALYDEGCRR
jgi:hypothetical protein